MGFILTGSFIRGKLAEKKGGKGLVRSAPIYPKKLFRLVVTGCSLKIGQLATPVIFVWLVSITDRISGKAESQRIGLSAKV